MGRQQLSQRYSPGVDGYLPESSIGMSLLFVAIRTSYHPKVELFIGECLALFIFIEHYVSREYTQRSCESVLSRGKYRVRGRPGPEAARQASHPRPEINGMEFG